MKKYLSMLMLSAALGSSAKSEGNASNCGMEMMVSNVASNIRNDFNSWDFSALETENCYALVIFSVNGNGDLGIENIVADDEKFKSLIIENLSKLNLGPSVLNTNPMLFKVALKHKRL